MAGVSPERAMRELLRQGTHRRVGLDELARQVAQRRRELLQKHQLGGTLDEIRKLLDEAVLAERKQLARDLDDDARFAEMRMEGLPASPAAAVTELADYEWRSSDAREKYEQIKDLLGRELLDQRFAGMKQALENATPEDRERVEEMLRDLGDLLAAHARGKDTTEQFRDFMDGTASSSPGPAGRRRAVDALAARAAAAQRMLASMTPEQRAELAELSSRRSAHPASWTADRLDDLLRGAAARRGLDGSERSASRGSASATAPGCSRTSRSSTGCRPARAGPPGARMDDVDLDALAVSSGRRGRRRPGPRRAREGAARQRRPHPGGRRHLRLSPRAMRELGRSLLRDVAGRLSTAGGARRAGGRRRRRASGATGPGSSATPSPGTSPAR